MFELPSGIRENVPGMLTEAEGEKLASLAADKTVLELGSYTGLSTIVMARVAKHVVACDWHCGDAHIGKTDTLARLDFNLRRFGVRDRVTIVVGRFAQTLPVLRHGLFDLAYIDGAHDFDSVNHDTWLVWPLLAKDATLAWHDADMEGVKRFLSGYSGVIFGPDRLATGAKNAINLG